MTRLKGWSWRDALPAHNALALRYYRAPDNTLPKDLADWLEKTWKPK